MKGLQQFVLHAGPMGGSSAERLPGSFFVDPSYWQRPDAQPRWSGGTATEVWQRLFVHYALNLYCAACRQIALAASGSPDGLRAAEHHTRLLLDDRAGEISPLRAWSDKAGDWRYGDDRRALTSKGDSAFFFGSICDRFHLVDPHTGASHFSKELGGAALSWNFYDPFLGENSWAALIGPLQAAWLTSRGGAIDADGEALQLALSLVPACVAMQSAVGGIYARPAASGRSQERLIANETNLTLYAGLSMLRQVMLDVPGLQERVDEVDRLRSGLLRYFRQHLIGEVGGELRVHTCGAFVDGAFRPGAMANGETARFAADAHTWGMSILGVDEIDGRHGPGASFRLWETVKRHAGFYAEGEPAGPPGGIGFSSGPAGDPIHDVCSPEWTFGAINMCRILSAEYDAPGAHHDAALAARLREDEQSMLRGVAAFEVSPPTEAASRAFLYVNRLADTGFGWHALPVPSLCATAWAVLVHNGFNPFRLGGRPVSVLRGDVGDLDHNTGIV